MWFKLMVFFKMEMNLSLQWSLCEAFVEPNQSQPNPLKPFTVTESE